MQPNYYAKTEFNGKETYYPVSPDGKLGLNVSPRPVGILSTNALEISVSVANITEIFAPDAKKITTSLCLINELYASKCETLELSYNVGMKVLFAPQVKSLICRHSGIAIISAPNATYLDVTGNEVKELNAPMAKEIIADDNPFLTKIYAPLAEKVSAKHEIKEIELFAPNASISEDDKLVIVEKKYW